MSSSLFRLLHSATIHAYPWTFYILIVLQLAVDSSSFPSIVEKCESPKSNKFQRQLFIIPTLAHGPDLFGKGKFCFQFNIIVYFFSLTSSTLIHHDSKYIKSKRVNVFYGHSTIPLYVKLYCCIDFASLLFFLLLSGDGTQCYF